MKHNTICTIGMAIGVIGPLLTILAHADAVAIDAPLKPLIADKLVTALVCLKFLIGGALGYWSMKTNVSSIQK